MATPHKENQVAKAEIVGLPELKVTITEKEKKKFWTADFWKDWFKSLSVALITLLVASIANYYLWRNQFTSYKEQKMYDNQLAAVHDFAEKGAAKVNVYVQALFVDFAVYKATALEGEKNFIRTGSKDVTTKRRLEIWDSVNVVLKKQYPVEMEAVKKIDDQNVYFFSSITYLHGFVPDSIKKQLEVFSNEMNRIYNIDKFWAYQDTFKIKVTEMEPTTMAHYYANKITAGLNGIIYELYGIVNRDLKKQD